MIQSIDQELLEKIAQGDRSSLEEIHNTYYAAIRRFIYFRVSNNQIAEDLTSAIFLRFFEYVSRGNAIDHVRGFLFRSAKNELANFYRDRKAIVDIDEVFTDEIALEMDVDKEIDLQLDAEQALTVIQKLKDEWRDVMLMRFMEELDYEEIANIIGKSQGAIRVIIHRALKELRDSMESS